MDEDRLARVLATLSASTGSTLLDRLLQLCVDLLPIAGAGVAVIGDGQHRGAIAVSDSTVAALDELQFGLGEGPCLDADRSARPVLEPDLVAAASQWPAFAPAALALGTAAVFAFPLRVGAVRLGVLSLYRATAAELDGKDLRDALTLSRIVTNVLLDLEANLVPGQLPERLAEILDQRAHIHQATGMIAAQLRVDVAGALAHLRAFAWSGDRTIDSVAADVTGGVIRFDGV
jgi:hypothetical protein